MTDPVAQVAVIVVSYNTRERLLACLDSLRSVRLPLHVVVVDNASVDDSARAVRQAFPHVEVIQNDQNLGFGHGANQGVRASSAPFVLILNSDAEVEPEAVERLVEALDARPSVAIAGPQSREPDGTPELSFGPMLTPVGEWRQQRRVRGLLARHPPTLRRIERLVSQPSEPTWVSGCCLMARRCALDQVGGFDESFFLYEEDVDLCVRVRRAGWSVAFVPEARVQHHRGASARQIADRAVLEYQRSHIRFYQKHNGPASTLLLRIVLVATAALGWVRAAGGGPVKRERRNLYCSLLRLALR